jgi:hypothetical protein
MKNLILSLFSVAAMVTAAHAQFTFGPEAGLNISEYALKSAGQSSSPNPRYSIRAGGIIDLGIGNHFSIQTGAYYVANGYNYSDGLGDKQAININTIEVPLNFVLKLRSPDVTRYWISVGPYVGFYASAKAKASGPNIPASSSTLKIGTDSTSYIKPVDIGFSITAAYQLPIGLFIRVHFNYGGVNLTPNGNSDNSMISSSYGTTIGFLFGGPHRQRDYLRYYK